MSEPRPERTVRVAAAAAWAFALMPAGYAIGRIAQHVFGTAHDAGSAASSFVPVAAFMGFLTAVTFLATWRWFASQPSAVSRWLRIAVISSTVLLVGQGVLLP